MVTVAGKALVAAGLIPRAAAAAAAAAAWFSPGTLAAFTLITPAGNRKWGSRAQQRQQASTNHLSFFFLFTVYRQDGG